MEHEVADRVGVAGTTRPDLVAVELVQARLDAGVKLAQLFHRISQEHAVEGLGISLTLHDLVLFGCVACGEHDVSGAVDVVPGDRRGLAVIDVVEEVDEQSSEGGSPRSPRAACVDRLRRVTPVAAMYSATPFEPAIRSRSSP